MSYTPDINRALPQDQEAEKGVLGSFMLNAREVGALCIEHGTTAEHFQNPAHMIVFEAMMDFYRDNDPMDIVILTAYLRGKGNIESVGGPAYITDLFTFLPTAANALYYIEILKEQWTLRRIIGVCTEYAARGYDHQDDSKSLLAEAQAAIMSISLTQKKRRTFREMLFETLDGIEKGEDQIPHIASGIRHLDEVVKMRRGNFIAIGGSAKSGKTTLAGTIVTNAAVTQNKRVVMVSLEMNYVEMIKRMLAAHGEIDLTTIGLPVTGAEWERISGAASAIGKADIEIIDDTFDLVEIIARIRKLHAEKAIDLIALDYLQLADWTTGKRDETREQVVAQISKQCKKLAAELNCVVIGLTQLNQDGKVRESRAIGMDSNALISVDVIDDGADRQIKVVGQRNGKSGIPINAVWIPQFTLFANPEKIEQPELINMGPAKKKARR